MNCLSTCLNWNNSSRSASYLMGKHFDWSLFSLWSGLLSAVTDINSIWTSAQEQREGRKRNRGGGRQWKCQVWLLAAIALRTPSPPGFWTRWTRTPHHILLWCSVPAPGRSAGLTLEILSYTNTQGIAACGASVGPSVLISSVWSWAPVGGTQHSSSMGSSGSLVGLRTVWENSAGGWRNTCHLFNEIITAL